MLLSVRLMNCQVSEFIFLFVKKNCGQCKCLFFSCCFKERHHIFNIKHSMHKTQGQNVAKRLLTLEKFISEEFLKQNILVKTEQITNIKIEQGLIPLRLI